MLLLQQEHAIRLFVSFRYSFVFRGCISEAVAYLSYVLKCFGRGASLYLTTCWILHVHHCACDLNCSPLFCLLPGGILQCIIVCVCVCLIMCVCVCVCVCVIVRVCTVPCAVSTGTGRWKDPSSAAGKQCICKAFPSPFGAGRHRGYPCY